MDFSKLQQDIVSLQSKVSDEMAKVQEMAAREPQLPKPSGIFLAAQKLVADHNYEVVVCGEVKKGKSSFINALLGQRLLPVNSDVATAQVFRISDAPEESFRLVFTDGTDKPISKEELVTYGSQVSYNLQGEPGMEGKLIDYIEVKTPARFLPKGVNIVDTPGLGALYRSHEAITRGYVRKAAAVIFVLDFEAPIGEQEKKFINDVLDVTPYVIYVATKSDLYNGETRKLLLDRNNQILSDIYAARNLQAPKIRPFSSEVLMSAAEVVFGGEEAELQSGYMKVAEDVRRLIYKSVGLLRTGNALIETGQFVNKVNSVIADILTASRNDGIQAQQELEANKKRLQQEFQQDWTKGSRKRRELEREINGICSSINNRVRELFSSANTVWSKSQSIIRNLDSNSEANEVAATLPSTIAHEISSSWVEISDDVYSRVAVALGSIDASIDNVYSGSLNGSYSISIPETTKSEKIKTVQSGFFGFNAGAMIGGLIGTLICPGAGTAIGAAIGGAGGAFITGTNTNMDAVKSNLLSQLSQMREQMNLEVTELAQDFVRNLQSNAIDSIDSSIEQQKQQLQEELNDLIERGQMDIEEKKREFQRWTAIQGEWSKEADEVRGLIDTRNQLSKELNS